MSQSNLNEIAGQINLNATKSIIYIKNPAHFRPCFLSVNVAFVVQYVRKIFKGSRCNIDIICLVKINMQANFRIVQKR